jgi:hypothetical protein
MCPHFVKGIFIANFEDKVHIVQGMKWAREPAVDNEQMTNPLIFFFKFRSGTISNILHHVVVTHPPLLVMVVKEAITADMPERIRI